MDRKEFETEEDGAKYFLLKRLKRFYFYQYVTASNMGYEISSISDFKQKMSSLGISQQYYSFTNKEPQSILGVFEEGDLTISYINKQNIAAFSTIPIEFKRGSFIMFRDVYLLYLIKKTEKKLLEKKIMLSPFTDEEIELYLK